MTAAVVVGGRARWEMLDANASDRSGACSRDNADVAPEASVIYKGAERLQRQFGVMHQKAKTRAVKCVMRLGMLMPQVDHRARRDDLDRLGGGLRKFADFAHRSGQEAECWAQLGQRLSESMGNQDVPTSVADAVSRLKAHAQEFAANPSNSQVGDNDNPFQDIIDQLNQAMQSEDGNLEQYEKIVEAVMKIVQAISRFMADVGQHVHSTSDGKGIDMDAATLASELQDILGKVGGAVCPDTDAWKAELAPLIPGVFTEYNGSICVNTNMSGSILSQMLDSISSMESGDSNINPAAYQAWWAGFQGMESQLENAGQTIAEKYSHRNSNFDNLIKIISSTVQSMVDTSKQFLQI